MEAPAKRENCGEKHRVVTFSSGRQPEQAWGGAGVTVDSILPEHPRTQLMPRGAGGGQQSEQGGDAPSPLVFLRMTFHTWATWNFLLVKLFV